MDSSSAFPSSCRGVLEQGAGPVALLRAGRRSGRRTCTDTPAGAPSNQKRPSFLRSDSSSQASQAGLSAPEASQRSQELKPAQTDQTKRLQEARQLLMFRAPDQFLLHDDFWSREQLHRQREAWKQRFRSELTIDERLKKAGVEVGQAGLSSPDCLLLCLLPWNRRKVFKKALFQVY